MTDDGAALAQFCRKAFSTGIFFCKRDEQPLPFRLTLLAALRLSTYASCVHIRTLALAAVPMPANLQSAATANHIIPESRRDKFFEVLEGSLTDEGLSVDRAGADECVNVVGQGQANNN